MLVTDYTYLWVQNGYLIAKIHNMLELRASLIVTHLFLIWTCSAMAYSAISANDYLIVEVGGLLFQGYLQVITSLSTRGCLYQASC